MNTDFDSEYFDVDLHRVILERAQSCEDVSSFTRFDSSMSVEQILASLLNISLDQAKEIIANNLGK